MPARRVPTPIKKAKGSLNVTRDKDADFAIIDGLVKFTPKPPKDFTEKMTELWNRVWRHLIKHTYGKESDFEVVETYVREYTNYREWGNDLDTYSAAHKAALLMMKASEQLGLNPAAMAKVAVLAKPKKTGLKEMLKDGTNE
jgi:phage terminase small subunit